MDIRTSYLGMRLDHPFIAGASPLGYRIDTIKRLEDAAVQRSSCTHSSRSRSPVCRLRTRRPYQPFEEDFAEALTAFPEPGEYPFGPDEYTEHVYRAKQAVAIPVIGSLNGRTPESWLKFARKIEHAGADALGIEHVRSARGPRHSRCGRRIRSSSGSCES